MKKECAWGLPDAAPGSTDYALQQLGNYARLRYRERLLKDIIGGMAVFGLLVFIALMMWAMATNR
jgi:hypothetical protein